MQQNVWLGTGVYEDTTGVTLREHEKEAKKLISHQTSA